MQAAAMSDMFQHVCVRADNVRTLADLARGNDAIGQACSRLDFTGGSPEVAAPQVPILAAVLARFRPLEALSVQHLWNGEFALLAASNGARDLRMLRLCAVAVDGETLGTIFEHAEGLDDLSLELTGPDRGRWPTLPFRTKIRHFKATRVTWDAAQWRCMAGRGDEPPMETVNLGFGCGDLSAAMRALAARGGGVGVRSVIISDVGASVPPDNLTALLESLVGSEPRLEHLFLTTDGAVDADVFAVVPRTIRTLGVMWCARVDAKALLSFLAPEASPALRRVELSSPSEAPWSQLACRRIEQLLRARKPAIEFETDFDEIGGW